MAKQKELELAIKIAGKMDKSLTATLTGARNQISSFSSHLRTALTHGDTNISILKCRGIIDSISSHGYDIAVFLKSTDYSHLMLRYHP